MPASHSSVDEFLTGWQASVPAQYALIQEIRTLFLAHRGLVESVKYGGLVFSCNNDLVGGIFPYRHHISIEFSQGAELADPDGLLQGKGKHRRHLKIGEANDLNARQARQFISAAVEAAQ